MQKEAEHEMKTQNIDEKTINFLKQCITGTTAKETSNEYVLDEETGQMKLIKQKVNEKFMPPNADIIKLFYHHFYGENLDYEKLTDEELILEKQRLLKQLEEEERDCRKNKNKN